MKKFILLTLLFSSVIVFSQKRKAIKIQGKIIVSIPEKQGVAVFNSTANKGTYTDAEGYFMLDVALNDVIDFSAIQFKDFRVKITEDVLKSKRLTVILVEEVNRLDEVVILPFNLTGNLSTDLEKVRTFNVSLDDVYFGLDHIENFEFTSDFKSGVDNLAFKESNPEVGNMVNLVNLAGFVLEQVLSLGNTKKTKKDNTKNTPFKSALEDYSYNYINYYFNIPLTEIDAFIEYVEAQGVDKSLLANDKEVELLERITQLSKSFNAQKTKK